MAEFNLEQCCADPTSTEETILNVVKKIQVHEINKGRQEFSEYHHLFPLLKKYPDKFNTYMRMKLSTFQYILSKVNNSLEKKWCNLHDQPIYPEEQLVVAIRFLATGASYSQLSFSFLMGRSTICNLIEDVLEALWRDLGPLHMPPPTEEILMGVAQDYYLLWDMPHCVGSIDVRHVRIKKPPGSGATYYNYKNFYSITLQAVVDARYRFVVIDVGGFGSQHDATTFRHSNLYRALKEKKMILPEDDELYKSRTILPYFFIGDGAYPLSKTLIKPYPGRNLTAHQRLFNSRLSRARVAVECAFGRLCQKWRIFYTTIQQLPVKAEWIVKATCLLQNIIIDLENPAVVACPKLLTESKNLHSAERAENENELLIGDGENVRKKLTTFFVENPIKKGAAAN